MSFILYGVVIMKRAVKFLTAVMSFSVMLAIIFLFTATYSEMPTSIPGETEMQAITSSAPADPVGETEAADSESEIKDGQSYYIISNVNGKYMNVHCAKTSQIQKGTAVDFYKKSKSSEDNTQLFTFTQTDNNTYLIQPRNSHFTVNVANGKAGSKIICWTKNETYDEEWIVEKADGGFTFRLKNYPDMYMTQSKNALVIQKKNDTINQIFKVE